MVEVDCPSEVADRKDGADGGDGGTGHCGKDSSDASVSWETSCKPTSGDKAARYGAPDWWRFGQMWATQSLTIGFICNVFQMLKYVLVERLNLLRGVSTPSSERTRSTPTGSELA